MDVGHLMKALATKIEQSKDVIGLEGVSYPVLNFVPRSPWLMVRPSLYGITQISKASAGRQAVLPAIDLVALVAGDPKRPGDAARLDPLMHPLLDLFDANANGGNVNNAFRGILNENVDRVWNNATARRATVEWGETKHCHALIITLDSEFKRKAELP